MSPTPHRRRKPVPTPLRPAPGDPPIAPEDGADLLRRIECETANRRRLAETRATLLREEIAYRERELAAVEAEIAELTAAGEAWQTAKAATGIRTRA